LENGCIFIKANEYLSIDVKFARELFKLFGVKQYSVKQFFKAASFNEMSFINYKCGD